MKAGPSHTLADKNSHQTGHVSNSAAKFGYTRSVTVLTTARCGDVSFKKQTEPGGGNKLAYLKITLE